MLDVYAFAQDNAIPGIALVEELEEVNRCTTWSFVHLDSGCHAEVYREKAPTIPWVEYSMPDSGARLSTSLEDGHHQDRQRSEMCGRSFCDAAISAYDDRE